MDSIKNKILNRNALTGLVLIVIVLGIVSYLLTLNKTSLSSSAGTDPAITAYNVGDTIVLDNNFSLLVEQVQISRDPVGNRPADGTDWVNVQITATNNDQDGVIIGQYAKYLTDDNGHTYTYHDTDLTHQYSQVSNTEFDQPLQGPSNRTGWLGFQIPRHTTGLSLIIKPQQQSSQIIKVPLNIEVN